MLGLALAAFVVIFVFGPSSTGERTDAEAGRAKLTVVEREPLMLRGSRFAPRERVQIVIVAGPGKRVTANRKGAFLARFANASVDWCAGFTIRARGSQGSRVVLRSPPTVCPS